MLLFSRLTRRVFFPPPPPSAIDSTEWEARKQQGCCEVGASLPCAARPSFVTALHLPGCLCVVGQRRLTGKWDLILKQREHKQRGRIVFLLCVVAEPPVWAASPAFAPFSLFSVSQTVKHYFFFVLSGRLFIVISLDSFSEMKVFRKARQS